MPRAKGQQQADQSRELRGLLWAQYGSKRVVEVVASWDPKPEVIAAVLEVVSSGCTVVLRPGSGGGAIGVAIWEREFRHEPVWCYSAEDLDGWASDILRIARAKVTQAAD